MTPCINLYPTTACDAKNDNRKQNTIASYAMKKFGIEYQGFLLRFCTHRNYFNWVFRSTKLRKYAIRSLIWSYGHVYNTLLLHCGRSRPLQRPGRMFTYRSRVLGQVEIFSLYNNTKCHKMQKIPIVRGGNQTAKPQDLKANALPCHCKGQLLEVSFVS